MITNGPEAFEQEDLLKKGKVVEISGSKQRLSGRKWKVPVRFWIGLMVFLTTYINYTTRVNMSMSIISMTKGKSKSTPECILLHQQEEDAAKLALNSSYQIVNKTMNKTLANFGERYDWDEHVQGQILGSYFWGYVITSLPGGAASEWWGPHKVIFWMTLLSGIINTLSVPAAWYHFGLLITCRFLLGIFGGFVYPAVQVLIAKWAPPAEKGKFVAGLMGNTLATCITWPLVGGVTSSVGWDWGFYAISIQCFVFCIIFWFVAADSPDDHKFITQEEVSYIKEAQGGSVTKKKHTPPYLSIMKSVPFWMLTVLHFGNLWGLYLQLQSVPKFMAEVVGFNLKQAGILAALPHLTRLFFGTAYGSIGDWLKSRKILSPKAIRKTFVLFSHVIPGILLIGIALTGCNWVPIVVMLTFSMAINGAAVLTNLQNPQDLAPNFAGSIFGIISFIGGMTGFIVPAITGAFIAEHNGTKEWGYNFMLGGGVYIVCGVIFILFGSVEEQKWNRVADQEDATAETK
ncbi:unnamed protein product [Psylliodes chrysocephalus]|uniref:Major facilitator superfamily (MFS) profile domain-containing protein n=1 Tax=Psylliodes chrysocephalus TaxID=3402493 RepID=A0A9P0D0V8_9CUCU|nr:unnamed protein product [Psylliodes chrysocephala]